MTPEQIQALLESTASNEQTLSEISAKLDLLLLKLDTLIQLCGNCFTVLGYILLAVILFISIKIAYSLIVKIFFGGV